MASAPNAKIEKVRDGGCVARKCVVIAHAVRETGRREIGQTPKLAPS